MSVVEPAETHPGTAVPGPGCAMRAWASDAGPVHSLSLQEAAERVAAARSEPGVRWTEGDLVWIDVENPGSADADFLRERLGFHPLAVEDCIRGRQRPKLDRYPGYFFLVLYAAEINPERERIALHELHVFLGARFVVTVHDRRIEEVREVAARWRASPHVLKDAGAIAHALFDVLVDDYVPVIEHFADRVEGVELAMVQNPGEENMQEILSLRRELGRFRKVVLPQRDVLATLLRRDLPFLRPDLLPYFQDVQDHVIRVTEELDTLRDLLSVSLQGQISAASNQLNQTVRMMTAWSIILMSMTLVAGVYGMNFRWMPELEWRWGYAGALGLMAAIGLGLVVFFRRRNWI